MEKQQPKKKSLPSNILLLGLISLFNDVSSEMITPVLPILISKLGGTGVAIGLIGGLRDSIAQIFKIVFGYISDRLQTRKILIFSGYLGSAVSKLLLVFAKSWHHILICVGSDRIGKAMRDAPRDALITLSIPDNVGKGFGIHKSFDNIGAILGSVFALILVACYKTKISTIIFISFFFGVIAVIPLYFVQDIPSRVRPTNKPFNLFHIPQSLKLFIMVHSIFSLADFSYMFFILHTHNTLSHAYTYLTPIMLYVIYNIFYTLFAVPFGMLSDDYDRKKVLMIGYAIFGMMCVGFYFAHSILWFVPLFCIYGIAHACIKVVAHAIVSDLSNQEQRATALGSFETCGGFTTLFAGLVIGLLWERIPHRFIFLGASVIALITCIVLSLLRHNMNQKKFTDKTSSALIND